MPKIELKPLNDTSLSFRLPKELKLSLPGTYEKEDGKVIIKHGYRGYVGDILRELIGRYVNGDLDRLDNINGTIEELNTKNRNLQNKIDDTLSKNNILYAGARELLKLMSVSKPNSECRNKVDMKAIGRLKEVI